MFFNHTTLFGGLQIYGPMQWASDALRRRAFPRLTKFITLCVYVYVNTNVQEGKQNKNMLLPRSTGKAAPKKSGAAAEASRVRGMSQGEVDPILVCVCVCVCVFLSLCMCMCVCVCVCVCSC